MLSKKLEEIGLSKHEAAVYMSLLEHGASSVTDISKNTLIQRAQVYPLLESLQNKQLATTALSGKRKVYAPEPPQQLQELLSNKMDVLDGMLPELITLTNSKDEKPVMRYVEGVKGIKEIYLASAEASEKELFAFVGVESLTQRSKTLEKFWDTTFQQKRKKHGVVGRIIIPDNPAGKAFKKKDARNNRESRMVPSSNYNFESEVLVYDNVVVFISYTKNEEFALSVESSAIAKTVKMIWKIVWNVSY